ncbi:MAG: DNA translocase FtsK 4TM domain-containing protein, partial [Sulfurovum sp.]
MKIALIVTSILFIYAAFSTLFLETGLVGNIGEKIGQTNIFLFGYLAYINLFVLFYPLYKLFKDRSKAKEIDFYLGWILLFIGLIFLESLVFDLEKAGFIGTQIVEFLEPYIGKAGLWLSWLLITLLSLVFILDDDFSPRDINLPGTSLSSWSSLYTKVVVAVKAVLKKIFTNPFASPKLEDEMMPVIEERVVKSKRAQNKAQKQVKEAKKSEPVSSPIEDETLPWDEPIDDPVIEEITTLEKDMEEVLQKDIKTEESPSKPSKSSSNVKIVDELEENSKLLDQIEKGKVEKPKNFRLPKLDFLQKAPKITKKMNEAEIDRKIEELLSKLQQFKVEGDVVRTYSGPLVTTFEFKPAPNVKVSKILNLQDDLAMALQAETIRIQAPIPGRDVVGIEIPNETVDTIYLREILESDIFRSSSSPLTVALGKDIVGKAFVTDIKKLPHILIAGTTGSGKSVGINAMILSLLYRNDPDHLKLMLIDPKMLEFSVYNDIPHLLTPVIIDAKKAIAALANMV